MTTITKEWLSSDAIDSQVLSNNVYIKARNAANDADVNIYKLNTSDKIEFASVPQVGSDPSAANDLVRKSYLSNYQATSEKNQISGYCGLDASGKVASAQLPSYVDDVVEAADFASLPGTGETSKIYVTLDTNKCYRWSGSAYVEISPSPGSTDSVTEGSTNLYFTASRAKAAAVSDSITDGVTDVAPSQNAVYDALAGKEPANANIQSHISSTSNPHSVTKTQVSLGNVDNVQQLPMSYLDTDNTLAADSDSKVPSQKAIKSYVTTAVGAITGYVPQSEVFTLIADDITNGYVDLAYTAISGSVQVFPVGGPLQMLTTDYTLSVVSSKTRVTFAGDLASKLVAGKKLRVDYAK